MDTEEEYLNRCEAASSAPSITGGHYIGNGTDLIDHGSHYRFSYKGIKLDPFRICEVYNITNLGQGTIVKKGLRLGTSIKDRRQDLLDIISAAERMIEMLDEDNE